MKHTVCLATLLTLVGAASSVRADEIKGRVKTVDPDKRTISVVVGDAEKTFQVVPDAKVTGLYGKKLKKAASQEVPGGLKGVQEGAEVTLISEDKGGNPTITEVKLEGLQPKAKNKAKTKTENKTKKNKKQNKDA